MTRGRPRIDDEKVAALTRLGWSASRIAEELGCCERSVVRARGEAGIAKSSGRRFTAEEIELADRLFDDGCSFSEVARTLGRHCTVVAKRWPGRGWTPRQGGEFGVAIRRVMR